MNNISKLEKTTSFSFANQKGEFLTLYELSFMVIHKIKKVGLVEFRDSSLELICIRDENILLLPSKESVKILFSKQAEYKKVPIFFEKKEFAVKKWSFEVNIPISNLSRIDWD